MNEEVISRVIDAAGIRPGDRVAELGAGAGTVAARVTRASTFLELDLIELDPLLCEGLRARFVDRPDVRVHCEDALEVIARERHDVVLSNLPAALTGRVLGLLASCTGGYRAAVVAAPASLDLESWRGCLALSPIARAGGADFDPPQPFQTVYLKVTRM